MLPIQRLLNTSLRTLATGATAAALTMALSSTAAAQGPEGLAALGPIDPLTNFPMWYQDKHGIKLGLCTNMNHCFFMPPDPLSAPHAPTFPGDTDKNWPAEVFWYACETGLDGAAGTQARGVLIHALEGAYGGEEAIFGQEVVFVRFRLHFWDLVPFGTYTFTYPFGQETHQADGDGDIFVTRDVGIGRPGDYTGALKGELGPFLLPVGLVDENGNPRPELLQPGMFLTQNLVQTQITGSPTGNNFFAIEGPQVDTLFPGHVDLTDARTDYARTDLFTVQGMVADRHGVEHHKSHYSRSPEMTSLDVFATSSPEQPLYVELPNGMRIAMDERTDGSGAYHAKIDLGQGAAPPAQVRLVNALDMPPTFKTVTGFAPQVTISQASYALNGSLVVQARSSDLLSNTPLPLEGIGIAAGTQLDWISAGLFSVSLPTVAIPPAAVTVGSTTARHSAKVVVSGANDAGTTHPIVANAGPDLNVQTGDLVTLSGANSQGDLPLTFTWTQLAGPPVVLQQDPTNPAVVTFVAPPVLVANDEGTQILTFHLNVSDVSADTVHVTVLDPAAVPLDDVRIDSATYDSGRRQWRVFGRTNLDQNQRVFLYLGVIDPAADPATWDRSRPIATIFSGGGGNWNYEPGRLSASGAAIPLPTDTQIWAESEIPGGDPGVSGFRRR